LIFINFAPMKIIKYLIFAALFVAAVSCETDKEEVTIVTEDGTSIQISENLKATGQSANDLLSANLYEKLVIELVYVDGFEPTSTAVNGFNDFLNSILNKPLGIEVIKKVVPAPAQNVLSIEDIIDLETKHRTKYTKDNEIAVFAFFVNGSYSENTENSSVLGVAYRNTSFVIFEETVHSFSGRAFGPSQQVLENTVINHEFGHILGLVNAGSTPQSEHQDVEHGKHCTTEGCLMFWTAETGEGLINSLSGGTVAELDALCVNDLKANGGK
jgi:hypothetical protein